MFVCQGARPQRLRKLVLRVGRAVSSAVEQEPFKLLVTGSNPVRLTQSHSIDICLYNSL